MPNPRRPYAPRSRPRNHTASPASARQLVAEVLTQQAERFPEIEPVELDTSALDERDAALAHALYDASIRRWLTLEYLIQSGLKGQFRDLEPALKAALILGSAQLVLMDRIPAHAAINESVEWAKHRIRPGAGGIVNAVLRRVSEYAGQRAGVWSGQVSALPLGDGSRQLHGIEMPGDVTQRLSVATSMPMGLVERMLAQHSVEDVRALCTQALANPPTVLSVRFTQEPIPAGWTRPHEREGHALWVGPREALAPMLATRRDLWAQDPSSSEAVASVSHLKPARIVDFCAGQGTKTRQLARTFPEAQVIATDVDPDRYRTLEGVFAGDERVRVITMPELRQAERGRADLVLLDVPCSNTGVMGRRVEARYRADAAALKRLARIQRQIIEEAAALLVPGGSILYATCSVDREENQAQAIWAAERFGMLASFERQTLPSSRGTPESCVDGSYSVLLTPNPVRGG